MVKTKKPKKVKVEKEGVKNVWAHVTHIKKVQDPDYFKTLSDSDKKTFSLYMINRSMSMSMDWTVAINYLQRFYDLEPELYYKLLINTFPKEGSYVPYIKVKEPIYKKKLIELLCNHFELRSAEAIDYLNILYSMEDGKNIIQKICRKYALEDKEIIEMCKLKDEV